MKKCKKCEPGKYSCNICYVRACMQLCIYPELVLEGKELKK